MLLLPLLLSLLVVAANSVEQLDGFLELGYKGAITVGFRRVKILDFRTSAIGIAGVECPP
jgi:hypothetical protein